MIRKHTFDDLSLIEKHGFLALNVSGEAEVEHDLDGVAVLDIWLDACRKATPQERESGLPYYVNGRIRLSISEHQWLWCAIADRLEKTIETEVRGRSDYAEHSTLHRVYQGV